MYHFYSVDFSQKRLQINYNSSAITTETTPTSSTLLYRDDIFTMDVTQATFLQIIISLIHPWGIDLSVDEIIEKLCHNHQSIDKNKLKTMLNNSLQQLRTHESPICIGLISKCGCMSLSMPGKLVIACYMLAAADDGRHH